jgi:hypothetical protein
MKKETKYVATALMVEEWFSVCVALFEGVYRSILTLCLCCREIHMGSVHFLYCRLYSCSPVLYLLLFTPVLVFPVASCLCLSRPSLLLPRRLFFAVLFHLNLFCPIPSTCVLSCPVLLYSVVLYLFVTYTTFCASSTISRSFLDSRFILPSVRVFVFCPWFCSCLISYILHLNSIRLKRHAPIGSLLPCHHTSAEEVKQWM